MIEKAAGPLKVAIVDPDDAARSRLNQLLSRTVTTRTSVVLECPTANTFVLESPALALDAVFVDITMPESRRLAERDGPSVYRQGLVFVSNKEIARALGLSHFTVRNHISLLFRWFEVSRRVDLATVARKQGLPLPESS